MANKILQGEDLCGYLDDMERAGMEVTRQWHGLWKTAVMYVWGQQLEGIKKDPDWDYIVTNHIYPLMIQQNAKLSKNNPKILARAFNDDNAEYAERWQGLTQYEWEQMHMRLDFLNMLQNASVYGYGVSKVSWDPRPKGGWNAQTKQYDGRIKHLLIHPAYFWSDTQSTTLKDARCMGTIRPVSLEWAIHQWPQFEKELRAEAQAGSDEEYATYSDGIVGSEDEVSYENQSARSLMKRFTSMIAGLISYRPNSQYEGNDKGGEGDRGQVVWLRETYFEDSAIKHVKIEEPIEVQRLQEQGLAQIQPGSGLVVGADGQPFTPETHPKEITAEYDEPVFPRGRKILRVGKTLLNPDVQRQIYPFSRWPFSVMPYHILPFMWQGSNAVEFSRSSQDMLNTTIAHLVHHTKVAADTIKVVEDGALAKDKRGKVRKIKGKAGELVVVNKGMLDKIRNLEPGRLDGSVFALIDILKRDIETQQFMHETAQGVQGKAKTAQEAARLDTNAHDFVSFRSIQSDLWVEQTASMIAEHIQKYYDLNRRVRALGSNGRIENTTMDEGMKQVEFDITIEPGSTLPFDEAVQKDNYLTAYKLLDAPALNPMLEDMLRVLQIANREKILAKHKQTQLFNQFMQLSAQAAQIPAMAQQDPASAAVAEKQLMQQVIQLMAQVGQSIGQAA